MVLATGNFPLLAGATVSPKPMIDFTVAPAVITPGAHILISWNAPWATTCVGNGFSTQKAIQGNLLLLPDTSKDYTVTCKGLNGSESITKRVLVKIVSGPNAPKLDFYLSSVHETNGGTGGGRFPFATFNWASSGATSCVGSSWSYADLSISGDWAAGQLSASEVLSSYPNGPYFYDLTCSGPGGSITKSVNW